MKSSKILARLALFCAASVVLFSAWPASAELVLVDKGVSRAPVVVFENAPRFTRLAADDLADYIEKISGTRPELIEGRPDPIPQNAIWVGYQPVLDELFPGIDFDFQHPEEILMAANESHLVVAGRDAWDPDNMVREISRGRTIEGIQSEYGTANAVYTFLQERLGVRWLWPGNLGEDIVENDTIAFEPFERRYHPQIRSRRGLFTRFRMGRRGFSASDGAQNWVRYHRLLFDSLEAPGGHAYNTWWDRFHETHPDYFALQPDGTRSAFPNPHNVKICHSNPDVWKQWLADVEEQLRQNPVQTVFNATPNDGYTSGHCICDRCRAWDHPDAETLPFTWQGLSQRYVAVSDRHITYANKIARLLRERYPDKDYYVYMMAYGNWRPVPVEARPDKNVIISAVANFHNRKYVGRTGLASEAKARFLEWGKIAPKMVWRPNLGFGIWQTGLPRVSMERAISDMRLAAENNVVGVMFDTVWGHFANHGPHYYMLAQMCWNPYADGEAILEDYYQRAFGKAAPELKAYWTFMEDTTRAIVFDEVPWHEAFNEAFFETAYGRLRSADEAVEGEPEVYRDRIGFVRFGLDYTRAICEARDLMARFRESGEKDKEAEDAARRLWVEKIRPMAVSEKYPWALNALFVRPGHGRSLGGLYPEDLERRW